jgi:hypothetical protein
VVGASIEDETWKGTPSAYKNLEKIRAQKINLSKLKPNPFLLKNVLDEVYRVSVKRDSLFHF